MKTETVMANFATRDKDPISTFMSLRNVSFAYNKDPILRSISLDIRAGETIGIIGPNGSGKSTLMKLMGGVLQVEPDTIFIKGSDLRLTKRRALAQSIAWIPQENPIVFPFKVAEVVMMGRHPYLAPLTFERREDHDIVHQAMSLTNTLEFSNRSFNEISGGEKQRVLIAGALAQDPEMMLLDEPTSALDLKYQMEILSILQHLNQNKGVTLVMALHDLHLASKFCNRIVLLQKGQIVRDGTPAEVLQKDILEKVYDVKIKIIHDKDDGSIFLSPEL
jgi:iron complex transport system ATP-binding protein